MRTHRTPRIHRILAINGALAAVTGAALSGGAAYAHDTGGATMRLTAASVASTPRCHTTDVSAHLRRLNPSAGNRHAVLTLKNTSGHACHTRGHVGMELRASDGSALPTDAVWTGGGGSTLTVQPGASVYTRLDWGVVPSGGEPTTGQCEPNPAKLAVTPPDEYTQRVLTWPYGPVCAHGTIYSGALRAGTGPAY